MRRLSAVLAATAVLSLACTAGTRDPAAGAESAATPSASVTTPSEYGPVRFAITVGAQHREPVWVQVNDEGSQPAWVSVWRGSERIWLQERCELADCGQSPAVCGAGIPMVRNLGGDATDRTISLTWDGKTSVRAPAGCEIRERVQASGGALRARICHSVSATREGGGGAFMGPGRTANATCEERALSPLDSVVVVALPR